MASGMTVLYVGLTLAVLVAAWLVASYRGVGAASRDADRAWSAMDRQLRRRHDLVPALVAAVREHAPGESAAVERLVETCAAAQAATEPYERSETERRLV